MHPCSLGDIYGVPMFVMPPSISTNFIALFGQTSPHIKHLMHWPVNLLSGTAPGGRRYTFAFAALFHKKPPNTIALPNMRELFKKSLLVIFSNIMRLEKSPSKRQSKKPQMQGGRSLPIYRRL